LGVQLILIANLAFRGPFRARVSLSASVGLRHFLAGMPDQSFLLSGKKF
jgi:hypothetical protein